MKTLKIKTAMMITMMMISTIAIGQTTVIIDVHNNDTLSTQGSLTTDSIKTYTVYYDSITVELKPNNISYIDSVPNIYSNYYVHFELEDFGGSYDFDVDTNNTNIHSGCDNSNCNPNTVSNFKDTFLISGNSTISYNISNYSITPNWGKYSAYSVVYHTVKNIYVNSDTITTSIIKNIKEEFKGNIYPNPSTNGIVNISFDTDIPQLIEVYSMNDQKVKEYRPYSSTERIDLSNQSKGMYLIRYINDNVPSEFKKLIIQ